MTRPRRIVAGETVMGTRRCINRCFLLRPDGVTNALFLFCLARAAALTGVLLHDFQVLSNHYHVVFTDPRGERPRFFQELNSMVARSVNAEFGDWESFFAPGSYNAPVLVDGDAIEDKLLYVHCNAVEAGLVKLPEYWDGVSSWHMEYGEKRVVRKPPGFFSESMQEEYTLTLVRPLELYPELSDNEARSLLRRRARDRCHAFAESLRANGGGFMGMGRVRRQPRQSSPNTRPARRGIRPTVASRNRWARVEALQRQVRFVEEHRDARLRYESGDLEVTFPEGTYLMVRRFGVSVATT